MPVPYRLSGQYLVDIKYEDPTMSGSGSDTNAWTLYVYMGYDKGGQLMATFTNGVGFDGKVTTTMTSKPTLGDQLWLKFDWSGPGAINVLWGEYIYILLSDGNKLYLRLPDISSLSYGSVTEKSFTISADEVLFNLSVSTKGVEYLGLGTVAIGGVTFEEKAGIREWADIDPLGLVEILQSVELSETSDVQPQWDLSESLAVSERTDSPPYLSFAETVHMREPRQFLDPRTGLLRTVGSGRAS